MPEKAEVIIPESFDAFRCLILLNRPVAEDVRHAVSTLLVARGCLFAMAFGPDSTLWDDSIDHANLAEFNYGDIPADKFVLTSWHDKEPLKETMHFAKFNSLEAYDDRPLNDILILDFSHQSRANEISDLYTSVT